jgi:hypothetical protein
MLQAGQGGRDAEIVVRAEVVRAQWAADYLNQQCRHARHAGIAVV